MSLLYLFLIYFKHFLLRVCFTTVFFYFSVLAFVFLLFKNLEGKKFINLSLLSNIFRSDGRNESLLIFIFSHLYTVEKLLFLGSYFQNCKIHKISRFEAFWTRKSRFYRLVSVSMCEIVIKTTQKIIQARSLNFIWK